MCPSAWWAAPACAKEGANGCAGFRICPTANCINWGILPFTLAEGAEFPYSEGDYVFVGGIRKAIIGGKEEFAAKVIKADGSVSDLTLYVKGLTEDEKEIILDGCLMNYYKNHSK